MSLDFFLSDIFPTYNGPGIDSVPSENEYQEYFLEVKAAGAWGWRPYHLHVPNVMEIWELKILGTLWATADLLQESFNLHFSVFKSINIVVCCIWKKWPIWAESCLWVAQYTLCFRCKFVSLEVPTCRILRLSGPFRWSPPVVLCLNEVVNPVLRQRTHYFLSKKVILHLQWKYQ